MRNIEKEKQIELQISKILHIACLKTDVGQMADRMILEQYGPL
jgi:hypothetical protein